MNHVNPNELYAGMYRSFRKGWDIISGGPATEGGIYKSTDGGETWTKLSNGLPSRLIGKIDIDVARSSPAIVYAMVEAPGSEGGLYRSDDAGASWRLINDAGNLRFRPFYFHYVDVNPKNPEEVWVSALGLYKSTNGGKSFATIPTPHADNHGIWFNPNDPRYAMQCHDGGANVTSDGGRTWSSILNQPTAELYMVSVDEQHPYLLYAPQQDNSTVVVPSVPTATLPSIILPRPGRRHRAARPAASGPRRTAGSSGVRAKGSSSASTSRPDSRRRNGSTRRIATATILTTSNSAFRVRRWSWCRRTIRKRSIKPPTSCIDRPTTGSTGR